MELIHYGSNSFDKERFTPIKNRELTVIQKPIGGLWTSPVNSEYGWKEWCLNNDFKVDTLNYSFEITLKENTNILTIDSENDLKKLPYFSEYNDNNNVMCFRYPNITFNFELLAEKYDAIWLTEKGLMETQDLTSSLNLYGWDCECVLLMNLDCFHCS